MKSAMLTLVASASLAFCGRGEMIVDKALAKYGTFA